MVKVVIFGIAGTGKKVYNQIKDSDNILYFSDNNEEMWGKDLFGIEIIPPFKLKQVDFDYIYIASMCGLYEIRDQLVQMGIPIYKLKYDLALIQTRSRILFLENFAQIAYKRNIVGAVAEAGVYKGEYAKEINRCFPDRKLYLFDTFEGFVDSDILAEINSSDTCADYLKETSQELVLQKMLYRENCIVRKGYFPETAMEIDEQFAYVSLDMDLYKPTLEGLRYFYPRMTRGGIIAIHDFFSEAYPNIERAVYEYESEIGSNLKLTPVGDDISISIIK